MLKRRLWACGLIFLLLCMNYSVALPRVRADALSCTATATPHYVPTGSTTDFDLELTNNGTNSINYVYITSPSANFSIMDAVASGWGAQGGGNSISLQYGSLDAANTLSVTVPTQTIQSEAVAANWTIQVSDDGGNAQVDCSGALDATITNTPPGSIPPVISDIFLSSLTPTAVTINWTTDEPASSQVNYGTTSQYGSSSDSQSTLATSHSSRISGLAPNTGYHYAVASTDSDNNTTLSADNTLLTPLAAEVVNPLPVAPIPIKTTLIKKEPTEKVPPEISLASSLLKSYKTIPTITGTASDNEGVAVLQYSLDGGKNWLPVDMSTGLGTKKVSFSFTPQNLQDGNYELTVNVIDTSSNQAGTTPQTLVIDRLPPTVGGNVIAVGSQILTPNQDNVISSLVGVDQKITMSAVGGPISVTIVTTRLSNDTPLQSFELVQSPDNGLWSGILSYTKAGTYQLIANSVDGAGNKTSRHLNVVSVNRAGEVTNSKGKQLFAKVSAYIRDDETNSWALWDGEAYDQSNPSLSTSKGAYGLFLPAGVYYLKVEAPDYRTIVTRIFTLDNPDIINNDFKLSQKPGFDLGSFHVRLPLPTFGGGDFHKSLPLRTKSKSIIVGNALPQFLLKMTNGKNQAMTDLFGQPTILSFVNTWTDSAAAQLDSLGKITDPLLNVRAISSGESLARVSSYAKLAGYNLPVIVDSDNTLFDQLNGTTIPVTYFIDRHGIVKKVTAGVLSKEELLQNVSL